MSEWRKRVNMAYEVDACDKYTVHVKLMSGECWQMGRNTSTRKRGIEVDDKVHINKRERHESYDQGSSTASTMGGEDDSSSSVGHHSDHDTPPKGTQCDDEASEAACSLASIMMSIHNAQGGIRTSKLQPASAPGMMESRESGPKSARSCTSGDEDDDNSGDSSLVKKQRRREKNRASAQQSRQRKKFHLEALEVRVDELERDRAALLAQVEALSAENKRLRGQNPAASGDRNAAAASVIKADELAGVGLLNQLAQAAHKLSALSS